MVPKDISIAIIGGGIGGLTAAVSLLQAGFDVRVYEQARWLSEVGAGINIGPNASRHPDPARARRGMRQGGVPLAALPSAPLAGRPHADPHPARRRDRGRVRRPAHDLPSRRAAFDAGAGRCRRSACIWRTAASMSARTATASRRSSTMASRSTADVLIAADGIHSTVRRALRGPERPRFACRAYRGLIPAEKVRDIPREFDGLARAGAALRPLFRLGRPAAELRRPHRAGRAGSASPGPSPAASPTCARPMRAGTRRCSASSTRSTRPSSGRCSTASRSSAGPIGRVTMLGDACHPMLPFMGQGGAQAIEDAAAITACLLRRGDDVEAALKLYETVRLPRASQDPGRFVGEQDPVPHARWPRPGGARRRRWPRA